MCVNCDNGYGEFSYGNTFSDSYDGFLKSSYPDEYNRLLNEQMDKATRAIDERFRNKAKRSIRVTDNVTLRITDMRVSHQHVNDLVTYLRTAQNNSPFAGKVDAYFPADIPGEGGVTYRVDDNGRVDPKGNNRVIAFHSYIFNMSAENRNRMLSDRYMMPVGNRFPIAQYCVTHEWGHVVDMRDQDDDYINYRLAISAHADVAGSAFNMSLSRYGITQEPEAYAEAFVEWALSNGNTTNFAAKWYAREYNWPKWK